MRELKFREWDEVQKQMREITLLPLPCKDNIMQYTGLKDKIGVEIYEGDILRWSIIEQNGGVCKQIDTVEFKDGSFVTRPLGTYTNDLDDTTSFFDEGNYEQITKESEVIGNIYENPELLDV